MALTLPITQETMDLWENGWNSLKRMLTPEITSEGVGTPQSVGWVGETLAGTVMSKTPQEAFQSGLMSMTPGMIASNFRTSQMIQQLRKSMAEEMRSRGPIGQVTPSEMQAWTMHKEKFPMEVVGTPEYKPFKSVQSEYGPITDPIDQILRGSWYHGMSKESRNKLFGDLPSQMPGESALIEANRQGIPISHHDSASISNKLGEPAGVSLSMLPTKARQFSADEFIHRVQPQYGGSPIDRTVNLMTKEGRGTLNDAYDVVANKILATPTYYGAEQISPLEHLAKQLNWERDVVTKGTLKGEISHPYSYLQDKQHQFFDTGFFNKQLSEQLQSQGKRGILYNPQRWDEYEMLMLDPKYALPLDYRKAGEYNPVKMSTVERKLAENQEYEKLIEMQKSGQISSWSPVERATPGMRQGLSQIQDLMSQNKSRLGDIYSERPWAQRLNEENKRRLLKLIDSQYREQVGNQLYGR